MDGGIERVEGDGRGRGGIPVGDVRDGDVFTVTVDEGSGKSVMVVDKRAFVRMMDAVGPLSTPTGWDGPFGYGPDPTRAESALREVEGAIRSDDAIVVFK